VARKGAASQEWDRLLNCSPFQRVCQALGMGKSSGLPQAKGGEIPGMKACTTSKVSAS